MFYKIIVNFLLEEINNKMIEVMKLENKQLIKIYGNIDIIKYYNNTNY